jgi:transposase
VVIVAGTSSEKVLEILKHLPLRLRNKVEEITLDMAGSMNLIAKRYFPNARLVTDRFHVQKLAIEAVQE